MAPTADEIRAIFNDVYKIGADPHHVLGKYVSEHAEVSIVGDDHKGITSVHDVGNIFAPITEQIDTNQPKHTELVRVIGGGADNEWAALEFNSSGWSINGMWYYFPPPELTLIISRPALTTAFNYI